MKLKYVKRVLKDNASRLIYIKEVRLYSRTASTIWGVQVSNSNTNMLDAATRLDTAICRPIISLYLWYVISRGVSVFIGEAFDSAVDSGPQQQWLIVLNAFIYTGNVSVRLTLRLTTLSSVLPHSLARSHGYKCKCSCNGSCSGNRNNFKYQVGFLGKGKQGVVCFCEECVCVNCCWLCLVFV